MHCRYLDVPDRMRRSGEPTRVDDQWSQSDQREKRHTMSTRTMPAIVLTLALVAACEEDPIAPNYQPPDEPLQELTQDEAVALFRGITRLSLNDEANPIHPGSVMVQCPHGGQVEVIEIIDEFQAEGDEAWTDVSLTIVPTACPDEDPGLRVRGGWRSEPSLRLALRDGLARVVQGSRQDPGLDHRYPRLEAEPAFRQLSDRRPGRGDGERASRIPTTRQRASFTGRCAATR